MREGLHNSGLCETVMPEPRYYFIRRMERFCDTKKSDAYNNNVQGTRRHGGKAIAAGNSRE